MNSPQQPTAIVPEPIAAARRIEVRKTSWTDPLGVSAVFLGLFLWGCRSSLRALVVGLVLFVTLHVVHAVLVPENLLHGIGVEVVATAGLVAGIWRELADRRALRSPSKAVATGA